MKPPISRFTDSSDSSDTDDDKVTFRSTVANTDKSEPEVAKADVAIATRFNRVKSMYERMQGKSKNSNWGTRHY